MKLHYAFFLAKHGSFFLIFFSLTGKDAQFASSTV